MWPFRWRFGRKRVAANGLAQAREAREAAEQRLAHAEEHVIRPLRKMREENHIGPLISELIQRRAEGRS